MEISGKRDIRNMEYNDRVIYSSKEKRSEKEKVTPRKFFLTHSSVPDSGYSSLPQSPLRLTETRLSRRSLSLQDTDTPFNEKTLSKRALYFEDPEKIVPELPKRNSSPDFFNLEHFEDKQDKEPIDILNELRRFPHIVASIFSYLNGETLTAICCVSKVWNQLCRNDRRADEKRRLFLLTIAVNKENPLMRCHPPTSSRSRECTPLTDYENRSSPPPAAESRSEPTNFERFVEAAKHLPLGGFLVKCMRCSSPSQVLPSSPLASCVSPTCSFKFCSRCHCQFTDNHKCSKVNSSSSAGSIRSANGGSGGCSSTPSLRIGSKRCKINLRRLRFP